MANGYTIEVKSNRCAQLAGEARSKAQLAVDKTIHDCQAFSAPFTPVDTSFLVNSTGIESGDLEAWLRWGAEYAKYQNGGTRYITGRHFAEQGAKLAEPGFIAAMREVFTL